MDDIKLALDRYLKDWQQWHAAVDTIDFASMVLMHAGWKVADELALGQKVAQLLPLTEQGHIGTVDKRKIVLLALKEPVQGVPILQIMQLRPGSADPLGLDHVAFYCETIGTLKQALAATDIKWEIQSNPGHSWISLWFGAHQREAKFFDHTSLDLGARELIDRSTAIKSQA